MAKLETKNEFIKGIIAGGVGGFALYLLVQSLYWLGLIKYGQNVLAGDVVFNYSHTIFLEVIAFFQTVAFGAFWGIILSFIYSKLLTRKYLILKGMVYGFTIFVLNLGLLDEVFKYPKDFHENPLNVFVFLMGYVTYGVITSAVLDRLYSREPG